MMKKRFKTFAISMTCISLLGLSACSADGGAGDGGSAKTETLLVTNFGGAWNELQTEVLFDEFEEQYGVKVELVNMLSSEALAKLKAAGADTEWDIVNFSGGQEFSAAKSDLIMPIDSAIVPNASDVIDGAQRDGGAPAYAMDVLGVLYDKDRATDLPTSWNDLAKPEFASRLALPPSAMMEAHSMVIAMAMANGGDINNMQPGFDQLEKIIANGAIVYDSNAQLQQLLGQGSVDLAVFGRGYAESLNSQGMNIGYQRMKEGTVSQAITMNVVAGSKNEELAQKLINMALDPKIQAKFAERSSYLPTNRNVTLPDVIKKDFEDFDQIEQDSYYPDPTTVERERPNWEEKMKSIYTR